jgi:electron transfer flavoprotein alpha subunit
VARAIRTTVTISGDGSPVVQADVARVDDLVLVSVEVHGPAVVTLVAGGRHVGQHVGDDVEGSPGAVIEEFVLDGIVGDATDEVDTVGVRPGGDPELMALMAPDLHTMDLSDATRVLAGGAGMVAGLDDRQAAAAFDLLIQVAAALGGSAGATRVATDAGWTGYERQIGTTGVAVDPDLYIALGVSGAAQHIGGIGTPRHVVSVNTDPSCPMTSMADLGLVTDAGALLTELADRLGVDAPGAEVGIGRNGP